MSRNEGKDCAARAPGADFLNIGDRWRGARWVCGAATLAETEAVILAIREVPRDPGLRAGMSLHVLRDADRLAGSEVRRSYCDVRGQECRV